MPLFLIISVIRSCRLPYTSIRHLIHLDSGFHRLIPSIKLSLIGTLNDSGCISIQSILRRWHNRVAVCLRIILFFIGPLSSQRPLHFGLEHPRNSYLFRFPFWYPPPFVLNCLTFVPLHVQSRSLQSWHWCMTLHATDGFICSSIGTGTVDASLFSLPQT